MNKVMEVQKMQATKLVKTHARLLVEALDSVTVETLAEVQNQVDQAQLRLNTAKQDAARRFEQVFSVGNAVKI